MQVSERVDRLLALFERLVTLADSSEPTPTDPREKLAAIKKKNEPLSSPQTQQPDDWKSGGMPRPWTS